MSNWKVTKTAINKVLPHPNPDVHSLEVCIVGQYRAIVRKDAYKVGDVILFIPADSILTGKLKDNLQHLLKGKELDRVCQVRLQNELSTGLVVDAKDVPDFDSLPLDEDVSQQLGIKKYNPPVSKDFEDRVEQVNFQDWNKHDCFDGLCFISLLEPGEDIIITEKVNGSQCNIYYNLDEDKLYLSSKNMLNNSYALKEDNSNLYWQAIENTGIKKRIRDNFDSGVVQLIGEVIPAQGKKWLYGHQSKIPYIKIFRAFHNNEEIFPHDIKDFEEIWVPILYEGKYTPDSGREDYVPNFIIDLAQGREQVTGKELHIKEGIVVRPLTNMYRDNNLMFLKVLNQKYKKTDYEIN